MSGFLTSENLNNINVKNNNLTTFRREMISPITRDRFGRDYYSE